MIVFRRATEALALGWRHTRVLLPLLLVVALPASAEPPAPWYIGAHVGLARVDASFGAAGDGELLRFNLGPQVSEEITLELEAGAGSVDFDDGRELDQAHASLNVVLVNRDANWNPYFLVGVGAFDHDGTGLKDTGLAAQAAIGGMWDLNGYGMMLRADLRYRHADLDEDVIDRGQAIVSIGIELPFGR